MEGCEANKISTNEDTTTAFGVTVQEVGPNGNLMPKFNTPVDVNAAYDPEGVSINVSRGALDDFADFDDGFGGMFEGCPRNLVFFH
jgi:hypothetical protein